MRRKLPELPDAGEVFGLVQRIEYLHLDDEADVVRVHDFTRANVEIIRLTPRAVLLLGDSEIVAEYG